MNITNLLYNILGKPDFGFQIENSNASFQIHLWYYSPPSKLSQENTVIYTVGLSQRYFEGACPWIELSFQVPGKHARPQLEKLGMILGELIYDTLKVTHFTPNLLLTGSKRLFMPEMRDFIVLEGAGLKPLWIETGKNKNIRILQLVPIYNKETPFIKKMGVWNTYRYFIKHKINFFEPNREAINHTEYSNEELQLVRHVAIYQPPPDEVQISQKIINWYKHNAPEIPVAKTNELPLKGTNLETFFGIKNEGIDLEKSPETGQHFSLNLLCERLYSGYYRYEKEKELLPNL